MPTCAGVHLEIHSSGGGTTGTEVVSWQQPGDFYYLMFVHDYSPSLLHPLAGSGVQLALWSPTGSIYRYLQVLSTAIQDTSRHSLHPLWTPGDTAGISQFKFLAARQS